MNSSLLDLQLVRPLTGFSFVCLFVFTIVLPQIFFNHTTLFSYPVFFSLLRAPLDVVAHFLVFLIFFRLKPFLSQFSPFVAQIKNFCRDAGFLLLTMFANDLTGCFSHCCVGGGDHRIYVCICVAHDGQRCKPPAYHSLEGFQHVGIFQLFQDRSGKCLTEERQILNR